MSENNTADFLKGLAAGALVGAVAGVLLAPKSGKETRDGIKTTALDVRDRTVELYEQGRKSVYRKINDIQAIGGKIDKTKYEKLVNDVVGELKEDNVLNSTAAEKLGSQLRSDWEMVKVQVTK